MLVVIYVRQWRDEMLDCVQHVQNHVVTNNKLSLTHRHTHTHTLTLRSPSDSKFSDAKNVREIPTESHQRGRQIEME